MKKAASLLFALLWSALIFGVVYWSLSEMGEEIDKRYVPKYHYLDENDDS